MNPEWWQLMILFILARGLLSWRVWQWWRLPSERKSGGRKFRLSDIRRLYIFLNLFKKFDSL